MTDCYTQLGSGKIHSLVFGDVSSASTHLLLVHGKDRQFQNATHWTTHFDFFKSKAQSSYCFHLLDLPGHGKSEIHGEPSLELHVESVVEYIKKVIATVPRKNIVLVGRSYGGLVVAGAGDKLLKDNAVSLRGLIFIAPAFVSQELVKYFFLFPYHFIPSFIISSAKRSTLLKPLENIPALLFWCESDCVVPFANSEKVLSALNDKKLVKLTITAEDAPQWFTHTPENDKGSIDIFHQEISHFLEKLQ